MGGPLKHVELLRKLHLAAGQPSMREIGEISGLSHTTVHNVLNPAYLSKWRSVEPVARALTDDEWEIGLIREAWRVDVVESRLAKQPVREFVPGNRDVHWILIPAAMHDEVTAKLDLLGCDLQRIQGNAWAAIPRK